MPAENTIRAITYALTQPGTALAAIAALEACDDPAAVEGLIEAVYEPADAQIAVKAIAALRLASVDIIVDALIHSLSSEHVTVRLAAVQAMGERHVRRGEQALIRIVRTDGSWMVRRAAVRVLARYPEPERWEILAAADDPHWRVRHGLLEALLEGTASDARAAQERLQLRMPEARVLGLLAYLRYRGGQVDVLPGDAPAADEEPCTRSQFWDWDAAVLARNLERLGDEGRRQALDMMPFLMGHADDRVRKIALRTLEKWGEARHIVEVLKVCEDPRLGVGDDLNALLDSSDSDLLEESARLILHQPESSPVQIAWARKQLGSALSSADDGAESTLPAADMLDFEDAAMRIRLAQELAERDDAGSLSMLERLQVDLHPHVRAAALSKDRAAKLMQNPALESSWHVLGKAARMMKMPLWKLEPQPPWQPPPVYVAPLPALPRTLPEPSHSRRLGSDEILVSPLGISGHYGLPVEGFVRAVEKGVNLLFWEPSYQTLNHFSSALSPGVRRDLHFLAGTFEAEPARIERDVQRALRALKLDRLSLFLIFWVQSWDRIPDDVRGTLEKLRSAGSIGMFGLSTHSRPLAMEAMKAGWNPIMVRHSAAHRGAEAEVLPLAAALGRGVITFNNTCYGRLLKPMGGTSLSPADCYRYSLAHPGVAACFSAPATVEQLTENLAVLDELELPAERRHALLEQGARVYREDVVFRKCVRSL